MLIVALVLAVIGLAALVAAVATSNEVVAWVCIGASALGVLMLIIDAIRDRAQRRVPAEADGAVAGASVDQANEIPAEAEVIEPVAEPADGTEDTDGAELQADRPDGDDDLVAEIAVEDHPDEVVHDEPDYDLPSDDEAEFPVPAEEDAIHAVDEDGADEQRDGQ